jgi:hypothetical protein
VFGKYIIANRLREATTVSEKPIQGERVPGGFVLITGLDGIRYAVRPQSVHTEPEPNMTDKPKKDSSEYGK